MKLPELPSLEEFEDDFFEEETVEKTPAKKKSIIPKTKYDAEGKPVLAIPDLDDVNLNSEIDRFFSQFGDKEGRK